MKISKNTADGESDKLSKSACDDRLTTLQLELNDLARWLLHTGKRYVPHLPSAGETALLDRSWYNRAGVERVIGLCSEEQTETFLKQAPCV